MRKLKNVMYSVAIAAAAMSMVACGGKKEETPEPPAAVETEAETVVETEAEVLDEDGEEIGAEEAIEDISVGFYLGTTDEIPEGAEGGPEEITKGTKLLFRDEFDNDFIALINEDTILPEEELQENVKYVVKHDGIATRSIPPIFNTIYEIHEIVDGEDEIMEDVEAEIEDAENNAENVKAVDPEAPVSDETWEALVTASNLFGEYKKAAEALGDDCPDDLVKYAGSINEEVKMVAALTREDLKEGEANEIGEKISEWIVMFGNYVTIE